ncbi:unnamed protein product [Ectocarpus sp. CCAP 1310/34]|nr:unnamed protein product [Ectocarpus sp. CCAP 1310/34]
MAYSGGFKEEDDDLDIDGEEEGGEIKAVNDHCILLIDARPNMFESLNGEGDTPFHASMRTAVQLMKSKVVQSDKHRVGVTFFGTKKTSDIEESNENVFVVLDLAPPSAKRIRDLDALAKGEVSFDNKYGSIGADDPCPLKSGLWSCQTEFNNIKQPLDHKRVFLFTNDDDPLRGDPEETKKVHMIAQDAVNASIEIKLFHIKRKGAPFDPDTFYRAIITGDGDDYNEQSLGDGAESTNELLDKVRRKEFKKRRLARLPFYLREGPEGTGLSFDVQVFNMVHPAKRPTPIYLDARTNKPVQIISKLMDDKTGAQLDAHEVRTYLEFAGERAYISKDEMGTLKGLYPKGLALLGFRPNNTLRPDFNIRSPYFLYPDEESTTGSAKAFIALHAAMVDKRVYALARFTRAAGAAPRMVALLPQEEVVEGGEQLQPGGFNTVVLPFADEVREAKAPQTADDDVKPEVKESGVSAAEGVVKALKLESFDFRKFENPVLQRHYAALQALALSEEEISWDPEKDDRTRPDEKGLDAAGGPVLEEFKVSYGGDQEDDLPAAGAKRSAGGSGEGSGAKRVKTEDDASKINWQEELAKGQIDRFTVPTLKSFLKSRGMSATGKKGDLVARVQQALQMTA